MALRHYERGVFVPASPTQVFEYVDDHARLASHMTKSSWMMGSGHMSIDIDEGRGQAVGSHIRLTGKALGFELFLEEVVSQREPPRRKTWHTIGTPRLLVIGAYRMGLEINPENAGSRLRVFIDYDLPTTKAPWLGYLFGPVYAGWCVRQMLRDAREHFTQAGT